MPIYLYKHPKTEELIEVLQAANEVHKFSKDGVEFERVYYAPNISIDSRVDPYTSKSFVEKSRNKKGTIGDLLKESKELSEKRGGAGNDPVLKNFYSSYQKDNGVKHSNEIKSEKLEKANNKLKKFGISLSD
jgi:hypothetical protein